MSVVCLLMLVFDMIFWLSHFRSYCVGANGWEKNKNDSVHEYFRRGNSSDVFVRHKMVLIPCDNMTIWLDIVTVDIITESQETQCQHDQLILWMLVNYTDSSVYGNPKLPLFTDFHVVLISSILLVDCCRTRNVRNMRYIISSPPSIQFWYVWTQILN